MGLVENDIMTLEQLMHAASITARFANPYRYKGLFADAQRRLLLFRRREDVARQVSERHEDGKINQQEELTLMKMKWALADIEHDPDSLMVVIHQYDQLPMAVRQSKAGMHLRGRAMSLHSLWECRRKLTSIQIELLTALQEALRAEQEVTDDVEEEFGGDEKKTNTQGHGSGEEEENRSDRLENDDDESGSGDKVDVDRLVEVLEEAAHYKVHMEFEWIESTEVLQRLVAKNALYALQKQRQRGLIIQDENEGALADKQPKGVELWKLGYRIADEDAMAKADEEDDSDDAAST